MLFRSTAVSVRDADVLGLGAVNRIPQQPAACGAVRVHAAPAVLARRARRDTRDEHLVARPEARDGATDLVDDADPLVAQHAAGRARRHVALADVQVRPADGGLGELDDGVGGRCDLGCRPLLELHLADLLVHERLHGGVGRRHRVIGAC